MIQTIYLGAALALAACQTQHPKAAPIAVSPPSLPVRQLRESLVGKSMTQVMAKLGPPKEVYSLTGGESWNYENAARDSVTGREVRYLEIVFEGRRVKSVDFAY